MKNGGTSINHLLFADDYIIFGRATTREWQKIQEILIKYERASSQLLNKQKITMFFSSNAAMNVRRQILQEAGITVCGNYEKYLGLPTIVGKSKYNTFKLLKDKVWKRISSWKNTFMSQA